MIRGGGTVSIDLEKAKFPRLTADPACGRAEALESFFQGQEGMVDSFLWDSKWRDVGQLRMGFGGHVGTYQVLFFLQRTSRYLGSGRANIASSFQASFPGLHFACRLVRWWLTRHANAA